MSDKDIRIGCEYVCRVGHTLTIVRIDGCIARAGKMRHPHWIATNLRTGREVTIGSPRLLQSEVGDTPQGRVTRKFYLG